MEQLKPAKRQANNQVHTGSNLKIAISPSLFEDEKKKGVRDSEEIPPVYTKKLADRLGSNVAVGKLLKCSGTTIGRAISTTGLIRSVYEELARHIWLAEYEAKPEPEVIYRDKPKESISVIVSVPAGSYGRFDDLVQILGGTIYDIPA